MNKVPAAVLLAVLSFLFSPCGRESLQQMAGSAAYAQDDWTTEFETVCARTQEAAGMPRDELKKLVERCDKLRLRIEQLDETQRKVYLKRLKMCRDLYAFVLESKEKP